jgi:dCTP diphosphatase
MISTKPNKHRSLFDKKPQCFIDILLADPHTSVFIRVYPWFLDYLSLSLFTMSDQTTTLSELRTLVANFVAARDWQQFHSPKNLSMSLAIEAAELMEHFQWLSVEQSRAVARQPEKLGEVADELADILCYALALANELNIDVADAIRNKMVKNERKYPAAAFRGRFGVNDPGVGGKQ